MTDNRTLEEADRIFNLMLLVVDTFQMGKIDPEPWWLTMILDDMKRRYFGDLEDVIE